MLMLFDWLGGSVPFDREAQIYSLLGGGTDPGSKL